MIKFYRSRIKINSFVHGQKHSSFGSLKLALGLYSHLIVTFRCDFKDFTNDLTL